MQGPIIKPSQPTLIDQASNLVLPSTINFSRRQLLLSGSAALLGCGLHQSVAAQEVTSDSHELVKVDNLANQLSGYSLRGLGFESSYQVTEWARRKLTNFQNGDLKIEGCSTLNEASDFLYRALSNSAEGFNALGEIHYARSRKDVGDDEWKGLLDSATNLRRLISELKLSKAYTSELPSQIRTASQPLLDWSDQYKKSIKVGMYITTASAVVLGALAVWNYLRENNTAHKSPRDNIHDQPGLL